METAIGTPDPRRDREQPWIAKLVSIPVPKPVPANCDYEGYQKRQRINDAMKAFQTLHHGEPRSKPLPGWKKFNKYPVVGLNFTHDQIKAALDAMKARRRPEEQ